MSQQLTAGDFDKYTKSGISMIDFWAAWCGPCTMLSPMVDELEKEYTGKVFVGKVDVDAEQDLSSKYEVMSLPTILIMKDGQEVKRIIGVRSKQHFVDALNEVLGVAPTQAA